MAQQPKSLGFGSLVLYKVLDLNCYFNSMTGYEILCYSFDMLDQLFGVACRIFLLKLYATLVVLHASVNSKPFHVNYNNTNLKTEAR